VAVTERAGVKSTSRKQKVLPAAIWVRGNAGTVGYECRNERSLATVLVEGSRGPNPNSWQRPQRGPYSHVRELGLNGVANQALIGSCGPMSGRAGHSWTPVQSVCDASVLKLGGNGPARITARNSASMSKERVTPNTMD
jgi:hypothetical protein